MKLTGFLKSQPLMLNLVKSERITGIFADTVSA